MGARFTNFEGLVKFVFAWNKSKIVLESLISKWAKTWLDFPVILARLMSSQNRHSLTIIPFFNLSKMSRRARLEMFEFFSFIGCFFKPSFNLHPK